MRYAITTLVMGGSQVDGYIKGAIALAKSARLFSAAELVCMVTPDITNTESLQEAWDHVVVVDYIKSEYRPFGGNRAREVYGPWIENASTKWRCLGLDDYDKVLFLDADMVIISPIDELFTMKTPAMMFDHQHSTKYVTRESRGEGFINHYIPRGADRLEHGAIVSKEAISRLRTNGGQFAPNGGLALLQPNRIVLDMYIKTLPSIVESLPPHVTSAPDEISITLFYHDYGYDWHHIDMAYNMPAYHLYKRNKNRTRILHYVNEYKPWKEKVQDARKYGHEEVWSIWHRIYGDRFLGVNRNLKDRIKNLLEALIGPSSRMVVDRTWPLYQKAFTGKDVNPVANYELLEAYGDRFLKGQYMWVLLGVPGIITADQVSKISGYHQDVTRLTHLFDRLMLTQYINADTRDAKVKSDVMEAFIAAVGISHEHILGNGNEAMKKMITGLYSTTFTVDPERYKILYDNPKSIMYELVQQLRLDRDKLVESRPVETRGAITITVSYDDHLLGTGSASLHGVYRDTAIREARDAAYNDALIHERLQQYVDSN